MKTIYLDSDFCCHLKNDETMRIIETDIFDGKCQTYIEGYRFVPEGEVWIRSDGAIFEGMMITPTIDYTILASAQAQYEIDIITATDMKQALDILGVTE